MNFFQKRFLTLAAFIANISLTLTVAGVATFAWYTSNSNAKVNVASSSLTIQSEGPDEGLSYEILKYDDNLKAGRSYTGSEAVAQFKLPFYDTYITERNQYANVLLRAEVTTSVDTSTEEFTIDITRLASSFKTAGVIGSKTSNVIQFKSAVYKYKVSGAESYTVNASSHNSIDETSAATKYATASAYFASKRTPTTFVPIRDNSDGTVIVNRKAEADTITLIPDLPSELVLESAIIYIECTYHDTLVSEFVKSHSESELSHSLDGDISLIEFGKQTKTANVSHATGKYIKVESEATASSGQYLPTYDAGSGVGKILKGSLNTGIDVNNNLRQVELNAATATEPMSIDSTDTIDDEAFTYDRTAKTLKTKGGYYIGNNLAAGNYSITTSQDPTNLTNEISFDNGHPVITSKSGKFLQHYSAGSYDRIRYYAASHPLDLYRYTENVAEMPTLVSIAITGTPTSPQRTFYTNHTFNLNGLEVTATYSDSSTAVVTHSCSFTSPNGVQTLIPEGRTSPTTFTTAQANKTVNISYSEGAVTLTNAASYTIDIVAEAITSLSKTGTLTAAYYYVGDTFSSAGVTVYGEYNSGITHANVTSSCTFDGYNMSSAGTYTVKANYDGLSVNVGTIYVRAKALSITPTSKTLAEGETFTITVTYNVPVTVSVTNGTGSVTSNKSSISYSQANKLTTTTTVTITAVSAGTATVSFSGSGVSTVSCSVTVTETPADHFSIDSGDIVSGTSYQAHTGNYTTDYNGTGSSSRGWVVTYGGNNSSIGTNSNNRSSCNLSSYSKYAVSPLSTTDVASAFASTDKLYKIRSIKFKYTGTSSNPSSAVYAIYSTDNSTFSQVPLDAGSTFSQGGTMNTKNTEYTFTFASAYTGYFALVFKANNSSGAWRIDNLNMEFNPVSLSSIAISGDCSTKTYNNGDSLSTSGLSVIATYSDGSTADVTASATLTPATNPLTTGTTSVVVNASYTDAKGVNKTASKTITGLTVNAVKVNSITLNQSTATISVGSTVQLSVTAIGPANADNKNYTWSVYSGGSYATVNSSGLVTGSAAGTAVIRATASDGGGAYAACTVTVTASKTLSSITISGQTTTFTQGGSFSFGGTVTAHYSDSTTANVTTSATFSGYNLSNTGSQTVTVSYTEGGVTKTATYTITVNAASTTISQSSFTSVSGYVSGDTNISYAAAKGTAGTAPAVYSNVIRIYQNGGTLTVSANNGKHITSLTIKSTMGTTITYKIDSGSASSNVKLSANSNYTVPGTYSASSILITCKGTSSSTRLYLCYIGVTYQ